MLWSLSGSLALIHSGIFGIAINADGLTFKPFVPQALKGNCSLTNFTYRHLVLDKEMEGYDNQITTFMIDGKPSAPSVRSCVKRRHTIKIVLADNPLQAQSINTVEHYITADVPAAMYSNNTITWNPVAKAVSYSILKNGKEIAKTSKTTLQLTNKGFAEYQVIATEENAIFSFTSEPVIAVDNNLVMHV